MHRRQRLRTIAIQRQLARQLQERHQIPKSIRRRSFPAQDIEIAVIRANFVKGILQPVPPVKYLVV